MDDHAGGPALLEENARLREQLAGERDALYLLADQALYRAKHQGRDRVAT